MALLLLLTAQATFSQTSKGKKKITTTPKPSNNKARQQTNTEDRAILETTVGILMQHYVRTNGITKVLKLTKLPAFFAYPYRTPPNYCTEILQTNVLAQSECSTPRRCGSTSWKKISSTWYGQEIGICLGIGANVPYKTTTNGRWDGWYDPSINFWSSIYKFDLLLPASTYITSAKLSDQPSLDAYRIIQKYDGTWMLTTIGALAHATKYDPNDGSLTIQASLRTSEGKYCLEFPRDEGIVKYEPIITATSLIDLALRLPFPATAEIDANNGKRFNPVSRFKKFNMITPYDKSSCLYLYQHDITLTQCPTEDIICELHAQTTSYSIPGMTLIKRSFLWILEEIWAIILNTLEWIYTTLLDLLKIMNTDFYVYEYALLTLFLMFYYHNLYRIVAILTPLMIYIGITRN